MFKVLLSTVELKLMKSIFLFLLGVLVAISFKYFINVELWVEIGSLLFILAVIVFVQLRAKGKSR